MLQQPGRWHGPRGWGPRGAQADLHFTVRNEGSGVDTGSQEQGPPPGGVLFRLVFDAAGLRIPDGQVILRELTAGSSLRLLVARGLGALELELPVNMSGDELFCLFNSECEEERRAKGGRCTKEGAGGGVEGAAAASSPGR